jgi:hypothetical protein
VASPPARRQRQYVLCECNYGAGEMALNVGHFAWDMPRIAAQVLV